MCLKQEVAELKPKSKVAADEVETTTSKTWNVSSSSSEEEENGNGNPTQEQRAKEQKRDDDEEKANWPAYVRKVDTNLDYGELLESFTYFLFVPTLVYRTSYPRTKDVNWINVCKNFVDVALCMIFTWVIFCRFCIPIYSKTTAEPGTFSGLVSSMVNASLPGVMLLLVGFWGVLHCWMNFWAEMLRFGDRQFYQDWWNARSFAQYYSPLLMNLSFDIFVCAHRRWNCVVHDWIYNYMYLPVLECGISKSMSMLIVFTTSAAIHEYVLFMAMKFFYPVLLIMFGGIGVFFIPLTDMWKNARGWNVFLWSTLLIGQGMLLVLYSREWFAQHDQSAQRFIDSKSWLPKSWQLLIHYKRYNR
ncbi:hypothetical protein RFI_08945 [Reticulomyxa filosa]|uniref:Uncharacterized protein n=1 Tax=Reticulomyxa filosa TaxID=46433 RepID=X6NQ88_RETFI|nr:hypothetical protein RFI_08945 [Reticulomyxa filosa]|eukprot:ETO28186.1 hypothetical protein RFI_08945 [Reticulomyxa filosa]